MNSLTSLARGARAARASALLLLVLSLLLSACQSGPKVPDPLPQAQGAVPTNPADIYPPGVLPTDPSLWGRDFVGPLRPATPATPYVGLLLPLSGEHAAVGQALLNAAQLAIFEIAGNEFVLIVRDTRGTPDGAREAARSALQAGASLILGPLFATSVASVAAEARPRGVSVIAFSNDVSVAGNGVFLLGLAPHSQIHRVVNFASAQGIQRYAILAPDSPYGHTVTSALQAATERNGVELSRIVLFDTSVSDPSPQVRTLAQYADRHRALLELRAELEKKTDADSLAELERLENLDTLGPPEFDAVMLPFGGETALTLAPLLAFYDIDPAEVKFLGTAFWDNPELTSERTLHGGWFAAPPPELWQQFRERYRATYRSEPVRIGSLAYDGTALAAVLSRNAAATGRAPDFSPRAITQESGFAGMDGIFRFLPNGQIQRGLSVLELQRDGIRELDPAPQSFDELLF